MWVQWDVMGEALHSKFRFLVTGNPVIVNIQLSAGYVLRLMT